MVIFGLPRYPEVLCNSLWVWCIEAGKSVTWERDLLQSISITFAQLTKWPFPPHMHALGSWEHSMPDVGSVFGQVCACRQERSNLMPSLACTVPWALLPASEALQCSFGSAFLNTFNIQQTEFLLLYYFPPILQF